jgi:hypothetical protein
MTFHYIDYIKKNKYLISFFLLLMLLKRDDLFSVAVGVYGIYLGLSFKKSLRKLEREGIESTGVLIKHELNYNFNSLSKTPLIEFTTKNGEKIRGNPSFYLMSGFSLFRSSKPLNQTVEVVYDKDEPEKFMFKDNNGTEELFIEVFIMLCLFFIGIGIYQFYNTL